MQKTRSLQISRMQLDPVSSSRLILQRCSKSSKRFNTHTHTVRDILVDRCPIKQVISNMFHSETLSFLSIKSTKKNVLIDFLSVLPEIATRACSKDNIKHRFIEAGIIDMEI
jgi:hypothetical protein